MIVALLVMEHLWKQFKKIIEASGREATEEDREIFMGCNSFQEIILLIANYVDDARTVQRIFKPGTRFDQRGKIFKMDPEKRADDIREGRDMV